MTMLNDLERSVKLERGIAGLPAPDRAAARRAARDAGPVGKDDPAHASRADRLVLVSLGKMSEGELLDLIGRFGGEDGGWADWLVGQAAARLERDYGYGALEVDEGRAAELGAGE